MICSQLDGRMGNNMFQIAAGASLAAELSTPFNAYIGRDYIIPGTYNCKFVEYVNALKNNIFRNVPFTNQLPDDNIPYTEVMFHYVPLPRVANMTLYGYFQTEKYFNNEVVHRLFDYPELEIKLKDKYVDILALNPTSIHVRRGDYIYWQDKHPLQPMCYYQKAMDIIGSDKEFIVTSDDIKWCKNNFKGDNIHFIEDANPVETLYLQSLCENNIIANSSFSWWGAWLNKNANKQVIAPKLWFGNSLSFHDTKDLIPEGWLKI